MRILLFIPILLTTFACKKEQVIPKEELAETEMQMGLPTDYSRFDGYFFAAQTAYDQNPNLFFHGFCSFSDPSKNLFTGYNHIKMKPGANGNLGNISIGEISVSNTVMPRYVFSSTAKAYYNMQSNLPLLKKNFEWRTDSNISFHKVNVITREFPRIELSEGNFGTINKKEAYELNIENIAFNYDSLVIILYDGSYNSNNYIAKSVNSQVKSVIFAPEEMANFNPGNSSGTLGFFVFNYTHKIRAGKLLIFEQGFRTYRAVTLIEQ